MLFWQFCIYCTYQLISYTVIYIGISYVLIIHGNEVSTSKFSLYQADRRDIMGQIAIKSLALNKLVFSEKQHSYSLASLAMHIYKKKQRVPICFFNYGLKPYCFYLAISALFDTPAAVAAKLLFQFKSDLRFKCVSHLSLHLGRPNFPRQPPTF